MVEVERHAVAAWGITIGIFHGDSLDIEGRRN